MIARTWKPDASPRLARGTDALEFRLVFLASLPIFLVASAVRRLVPRRGRPSLPLGAGSPSIIQEARAAAYTAVLPAFMN